MGEPPDRATAKTLKACQEGEATMRKGNCCRYGDWRWRLESNAVPAMDKAVAELCGAVVMVAMTAVTLAVFAAVREQLRKQSSDGRLSG
jgi:hypothetical protein